MIGPILDILVEIGLIREDYRHHKKITNKEKQDGVKRPFQRYFLQPSTVIYGSVFIISVISLIIFFTIRRTFVFPEKTKKELTEISEWTEKWKEKYGSYPNELSEIIGNSPLRQNWDKDAWDRPYRFVKSEDGLGFLIISAGADGKFGTEDDIQSE